MKDRFYIIIVESLDLVGNSNALKFHKNITTAGGVKAWWHYLERTYIIKVGNNISATDVAEFIIEKLPNKKFYVSEITLENHNGFLPKDAWDWLKNQGFAS